MRAFLVFEDRVLISRIKYPLKLAEIRRYFEDAATAVQHDRNSRRLRPLCQLIFEITRELLSSPNYKAATRNTPLNHFLQGCTYIKQHLGLKITAEQTAAHLGISADHSNRLFRRFSGLSFKQYLTHLPQLYNIAKDPKEQNNLASQHPEILARLMADFFAWCNTFERSPMWLDNPGWLDFNIKIHRKKFQTTQP